MANNTKTNTNTADIEGIFKYLPDINERPLHTALDFEIFNFWVAMEKGIARMWNAPGITHSYLVALKNFFLEYRFRAEHMGETLKETVWGFACTPSFAGTIHPTQSALYKVEGLRKGVQRCVVEMYTEEPRHPLVGPLLAAYAMAYTPCLRLSIQLKPDASFILTLHNNDSDVEALLSALERRREMKEAKEKAVKAAREEKERKEKEAQAANEREEKAAREKAMKEKNEAAKAKQREEKDPFEAFRPNGNNTGKPTLLALPRIEGPEGEGEEENTPEVAAEGEESR